VSVDKRLQKLETSLPPAKAGLFWLKDTLEFGQHRRYQDMWADPRRRRGEVVKQVGEAVHKNLGDPPLEREVLDQAVREAQKQTDTLMVLILDVHEYVRSESRLNNLRVDLALEKYLRLLERYAFRGEFDPEAWDSWRAMLIETWAAISRLRKLVDSISETYFDGHALLFPEDDEVLNSDNSDLEGIAKSYNRSQHNLPHWKAIDLDAELSLIAEYVPAQAEHFVLIAKAKTLDAFGERGAAMKLLDLCEIRISCELKRLRSLSEPRG
jgi:hypothetical protein